MLFLYPYDFCFFFWFSIYFNIYLTVWCTCCLDPGVSAALALCPGLDLQFSSTWFSVLYHLSSDPLFSLAAAWMLGCWLLVLEACVFGLAAKALIAVSGGLDSAWRLSFRSLMVKPSKAQCKLLLSKLPGLSLKAKLLVLEATSSSSTFIKKTFKLTRRRPGEYF